MTSTHDQNSRTNNQHDARPKLVENRNENAVQIFSFAGCAFLSLESRIFIPSRSPIYGVLSEKPDQQFSITHHNIHFNAIALVFPANRWGTWATIIRVCVLCLVSDGRPYAKGHRILVTRCVNACSWLSGSALYMYTYLWWFWFWNFVRGLCLRSRYRNWRVGSNCSQSERTWKHLRVVRMMSGVPLVCCCLLVWFIYLNMPYIECSLKHKLFETCCWNCIILEYKKKFLL